MMLFILVIRISNIPIDRLPSQFWMGPGRKSATRWSASGTYGYNVLKTKADRFVTWPLSAKALIIVCFNIGFPYKSISNYSNMPKTLSGRQRFGEPTPTSSHNELVTSPRQIEPFSIPVFKESFLLGLGTT
jgi:hypothetical protein